MAELAPGEWLNDKIINFHISLIQERANNDPSLPMVLAMDTFFYQGFLSKSLIGLLSHPTRKNSTESVQESEAAKEDSESHVPCFDFERFLSHNDTDVNKQPEPISSRKPPYLSDC
uniref:Uncharacterized protein n=1 Tax=Ditylenchus dipsaci TaxID=166011 RepID=A0A915DFX9_9BILA